MKSSIKNIVAFLPLIKSLQAQFIPEAEARLTAWRAYGSFVSQQLTAGLPLNPGKDFIYVTPPNFVAIRGGTPCPASVTNFDLFKLADGLQLTNEPLLNNAGTSYVEDLYTYLQSVDLKTATPTAAQTAKIVQLTDALSAAQTKFDEESNNAYTRYLADARAQATKQSFSSWVTQKAPLYTSLLRQVKTANTALQNYEVSVFGPQYQALSTARDKITNQAGDEFSPVPGYNMGLLGSAGTYDVKISPFQQNEENDGLIYKPLYSITGGFEETLDAWINYTGPVNTRYDWSFNNVNGRDWSSLGHTTSVTNVGGSGFFGLISASHAGSTETTVFDSWTSKFSTSISLSLTMKGLQVFNVDSGFWDVGGVRSKYPNLLAAPLGTDSLKNKVKLQRLLIGSEVGLTITIRDTGTWQSVYKFIQDSKSRTGGGLSLFGFRFGAGGSKVTHREYSDIQTTTQAEGGTIVIAPSAKGITVLLGALGKAL